MGSHPHASDPLTVQDLIDLLKNEKPDTLVRVRLISERYTAAFIKDTSMMVMREHACQTCGTHFKEHRVLELNCVTEEK